jgi:hypothetical protein
MKLCPNCNRQMKPYELHNPLCVQCLNAKHRRDSKEGWRVSNPAHNPGATVRDKAANAARYARRKSRQWIDRGKQAAEVAG